MSVTIAKNLLRVVLLLITIQGIAPVLAKAKSGDFRHTIVEHKPDHASLFYTVLFEKMEEEKKSGGGKDRFLTIELLDFSIITTMLSQAHTPASHFQDRFDLQPPLFTLFCVFLI